MEEFTSMKCSCCGKEFWGEEEKNKSPWIAYEGNICDKCMPIVIKEARKEEELWKEERKNDLDFYHHVNNTTIVDFLDELDFEDR